MPRTRRSRKTSASPSQGRQTAHLLQGTEAARPLASLVFLSPLLTFYVVGLIWVRPDLAAGADVLLRQALRLLGVSGVLAPTWLVVAVLLVWHLARRDPWRLSWGLLAQMATETALLVIPLFVMLLAFNAFSHSALAMGGAAAPGPLWLDVAMGGIGAGIYEELLFRLLLVGGPLLVLRHVLHDDSFGARVAVVLIVAALFSGAHHMANPAGFTWTLFLFRAAAGVYLGFVFVYRGFGIAAGVHILYNLIVNLTAA